MVIYILMAYNLENTLETSIIKVYKDLGNANIAMDYYNDSNDNWQAFVEDYIVSDTL